MVRKKYYSDSERLKARRKVPDIGRTEKISHINIKQIEQDSFSKTIIEKTQKSTIYIPLGCICIFVGGLLGYAIDKVFNYLIVLGLYFLFLSRRSKIYIQYDRDKKLVDEYNKLSRALMDIELAYESKLIKKQTYVRQRTHGNANAILHSRSFRVKIGSSGLYKTNVLCVKFPISPGEYFLLLPDKILYCSSGTIQFFKYSQLHISMSSLRYQREGIIKDAELLGYVWENVNLDGSPDLRFKYNKQIPQYLYAVIYISAPIGINLELLCSSRTRATSFVTAVRQYKDLLNKTYTETVFDENESNAKIIMKC